MGLVTVAGVGLGLAMDAVAVSLVSGLAKRRLATRDAPLMAAVFGFFQALMPLIGFGIGAVARDWVQAIDHWIAFALLALIGAKMAWEGWHFHPDVVRGDPFALRRVVLKGIATSLDALAVGFSLSVLGVPVLVSAGLIGLITFALCLPAVWLGSRLGERWAAGAEILGGLLLIAIGAKVLVDHLGT